MLFRTLIVALVASCGATASSSPDVHVDPLPVAPRPRTAAEPAAPRGVMDALPTFEEAWSERHAATGVDLTDAELAEPLQRGAFVNRCGAPSSMKVSVKVAVLDGRAAGVTVTTDPEDADVARCIDAEVRGLRWPSSPHMDAVHTTY